MTFECDGMFFGEAGDKLQMLFKWTEWKHLGSFHLSVAIPPLPLSLFLFLPLSLSLALSQFLSLTLSFSWFSDAHCAPVYLRPPISKQNPHKQEKEWIWTKPRKNIDLWRRWNVFAFADLMLR